MLMLRTENIIGYLSTFNDKVFFDPTGHDARYFSKMLIGLNGLILVSAGRFYPVRLNDWPARALSIKYSHEALRLQEIAANHQATAQRYQERQRVETLNNQLAPERTDHQATRTHGLEPTMQ
jgi:hypothetical protein